MKSNSPSGSKTYEYMLLAPTRSDLRDMRLAAEKQSGVVTLIKFRDQEKGLAFYERWLERKNRGMVIDAVSLRRAGDRAFTAGGGVVRLAIKTEAGQVNRALDVFAQDVIAVRAERPENRELIAELAPSIGAICYTNV